MAIVNFAMSFPAALPNSVHSQMPVTKIVSRHTRPLPYAKLPILNNYFQALHDAYGAQHWWPGRSRFEVIVGAILTQNTSWANVEAAIKNLREARMLTVRGMEAVSLAKLARLVRPSGYFRQKAKKLKAFTHFLYENYGGSLSRMFRRPTSALREQLLAIHGIGPETADSILLYAGKHTVFVIDTYARRILERHALAAAEHSYEELRSLFESSLPRDTKLFNEYHALIVRTGKEFCRKSAALCAACPLRPFLPASESA